LKWLAHINKAFLFFFLLWRDWLVIVLCSLIWIENEKERKCLKCESDECVESEKGWRVKVNWKPTTKSWWFKIHNHPFSKSNNQSFTKQTKSIKVHFKTKQKNTLNRLLIKEWREKEHKTMIETSKWKPFDLFLFEDSFTILIKKALWFNQSSLFVQFLPYFLLRGGLSTFDKQTLFHQNANVFKNQWNNLFKITNQLECLFYFHFEVDCIKETKNKNQKRRQTIILLFLSSWIQNQSSQITNKSLWKENERWGNWRQKREGRASSNPHNPLKKEQTANHQVKPKSMIEHCHQSSQTNKQKEQTTKQWSKKTTKSFTINSLAEKRMRDQSVVCFEVCLMNVFWEWLNVFWEMKVMIKSLIVVLTKQLAFFFLFTKSFVSTPKQNQIQFKNKKHNQFKQNQVVLFKINQSNFVFFVLSNEFWTFSKEKERKQLIY
jgi:hypothetical protein